MDNPETLNLILVEDDEAAAMVLRADLDGDGLPLRVHWTCMASVAEAERALPSCRADAVLLSLDLADVPGLGALHAVRRAALRIPVIALSGDDRIEPAVAALRAGAQDHFVKEAEDADSMVRRIRFAVERARVGPPPASPAAERPHHWATPPAEAEQDGVSDAAVPAARLG